MQTQIGYVDQETLQVTLDSTFGDNVFIVTFDESAGYKTFYLEYGTSVTQTQIDQAVLLSDQNSIDLLNSTKLDLYVKMNIKSEKVILKKERPRFTEAETQEAYYWLQNQSTPVPGCVLYVSIADGVSNTVAAQSIVNSQAVYDAYVNQVNAIKIQSQNEIMASTSLLTAKQIATDAIEQIKNVA